MRIALLISSLQGGGAERVCVRLAQGFVGAGHEVIVITFDEKRPDAYQLPPGVERIRLALHSKTRLLRHFEVYSKVKKLRSAILSSGCSVIISFMGTANILCSLAVLRTKIKHIANEQNYFLRGKGRRKWLLRFCKRIMYPTVDQVVSVSKDISLLYNWLPESKRTVIYNPAPFVPREEESEQPALKQGKKWILGVGRFTEQKGFDLAIAAFAKIAHRFPNYNLVLCGTGEQMELLQGKVLAEGLSNRVEFPGFVENIHRYYRSSEIFLLSSRWEGFPCALIEAMAFGLAAVAFDCKTGPREVIRHRENGLLVPSENVEALSEALTIMIEDETLRKHLGESALATRESFSISTIVSHWERLFQSLGSS